MKITILQDCQLISIKNDIIFLEIGTQAPGMRRTATVGAVMTAGSTNIAMTGFAIAMTVMAFFMLARNDDLFTTLML